MSDPRPEAPQPLPVTDPAATGNIGASVIRTVVPLAVSFVVSWLVSKGIDPGPYKATIDSLVGAAVAAVYYAVVRILETRLGRVWGWLLGLPKQPTYHPPVGSALSGDHLQEPGAPQ